MVRFWSYIFTPLLILVIVFAMFVIFTLSSAQTTVGSLIAPALAITSSVVESAASAANVVKAELEHLRGDKYLNLIFDQIAPEILAAYELEIPLSNRAMIGSSMGALSTLYAGIQRPEQMSALLALSPHWTIGGNRLVERTVEELPKPGTHKIWMSRGTKSLDADYKPFQELADRLMKEKGYRIGQDFVTKVYDKTSHNERSWAGYLDQVMKFWLD
jgi:enterochelin esterase-like enzyme